MDLPVELWMRIFEEIRHDDDCVRPKRVNAYNEALSRGATELEASTELPLFEKRFWRTTRAYYNISRNSHAAASRLSLTQKLLSRCKRPVMIARDMGHECDLGHIKQLMPSSPAIIQLLHRSSLDESEFSMRPGKVHHWTMSLRVQNGIHSSIPYLDHVDHMILLPPSPRSCDCCSDSYLLYYAVCAKNAIENSRLKRGVSDARIEVFL
ncbi:hypothetical protein Q7P37_005609 [Cladosporium fusiforme]